MLLSRSQSAVRAFATFLLIAGLPLVAAAQTLARPGWAGSGIAADAWWRTAVFYRVDVRHFGDSDADGKGDLRGLAERLDYLQSLGVDAVVLLTTPGETGSNNPIFDEAGFDALRREGAGRRIRIVVGLDAAVSRDALVPLARQWLTRGAAGVYLQRAAGGSPAPAPAETAMLLRDLRSLADTFPGQRVVLSEATPAGGAATSATAPITTLAPRGGRSIRSGTAQLTDVQIVSGADVLEREMSDFDSATDSAPLLLTDARFRSANAFYAEGTAEQLGRNKILATVLLSFRGAVSLRYGQELGLAAEAGGAAPLTMQWTPANVTPAAAAATVAPPDPNVYGPYVPYVKPKPKPNGTSSGVDPDSLKGFTSGELTEAAGRTNRALANVALEDADPGSLLNYYRRLVQLHHGNSSIRSGAVHILHAETDAGSGSTLLWMRRAPVGSRTAANVVVACNLGDKPMRVSVDHDLERLRLGSGGGAGTLRPLLASWTETPAAQTTGNITLPPYSVFVGELSHAAGR